MTSPLVYDTNTPSRRANWLERYLKVQLTADRAVYAALEKAGKAAEAQLLSLATVDGVGASVRRSQLATARRAIGATLNDLFGSIQKTVATGQKNAVDAAVDAALTDEAEIMVALFPDPGARADYAASLKQTAERNVQSLIVRVTKSKLTLSRQVYNSKMIANGWVDTEINNALARGDSAAVLAKAIRGSINPATPGGVSYASKRLARSEINNAYHAQSIVHNEDTPWVQSVEWHLSNSHPSGHPDICDVYAKRGLFHKDQVPAKPHPQCLCYITPVVIDFDTFQNHLIAGAYNGWLNENVAA